MEQMFRLCYTLFRAKPRRQAEYTAQSLVVKPKSPQKFGSQQSCKSFTSSSACACITRREGKQNSGMPRPSHPVSATAQLTYKPNVTLTTPDTNMLWSWALSS